ncbi:uncharacterized protein V1518DRAFT_190601 [Limtongia smithiae]|uniref:uncharacterized protein n=1 Tax=Limtongia smithiae TaxID=1125753 RepID=UPI0034CD42F2
MSDGLALLSAWARLHDITISPHVAIQRTADAGLGLFFKAMDDPNSDVDLSPLTGSVDAPLLSIPRSMILSSENIKNYALAYKATLLPFVTSSATAELNGRNAFLPAKQVILRFFLFALHKFNKSSKLSTAAQSGFYAPYISLLPDPLQEVIYHTSGAMESLSLKSDDTEAAGEDSAPSARAGALLPPTYWTAEQIQEAAGTSLYLPLMSKMKSLHAMYDQLLLDWDASFGGDEEEVTWEDFLRAEWLVASRVLEVPVSGHENKEGADMMLAVVPVIDFANHNARYNARYEITCSEILLVSANDAAKPQSGDEICISYGVQKGTAELLLTYGFYERPWVYEGEETVKMPVMAGTNVLRQLFGTMPLAELHVARSAEGEFEVHWECDYLWMLCVGKEDGFAVSVSQQHDGSEDIDAVVNGKTLTNARGEAVVEVIRSELATEEMRDVLELRRVVIFEELLSGWMDDIARTEALVEHDDELQKSAPEAEFKHDAVDEALETLRQREERVFGMTLEAVAARKLQLLDMPAVARYLAKMQEDTPDDAERGAGAGTSATSADSAASDSEPPELEEDTR